jgi:hypothetical protein
VSNNHDHFNKCILQRVVLISKGCTYTKNIARLNAALNSKTLKIRLFQSLIVASSFGIFIAPSWNQIFVLVSGFFVVGMRKLDFGIKTHLRVSASVRQCVSALVGQWLLPPTTLGTTAQSIATLGIIQNEQHNDVQHNDTQHNDTHNGVWHNDTQHNDTQHVETLHNDNQHNDTQHYDTQHNNIQHNDNQHNGTQDNDTQHNDTQINETQHNDTQHNDTQHNDTQHNDTQKNDTQHNDTQHNDTQKNDTQHNDNQHNDT